MNKKLYLMELMVWFFFKHKWGRSRKVDSNFKQHIETMESLTIILYTVFLLSTFTSVI